jgi:hypothetical protein
MALPTPPNIYTPIPNSTFYSDPTWNLVGSQGPLIVGQGLEVNASDSEVIAIPQTSVGVNSIIAGLGISVDQPDGDVTITNTGVLNIQAGPHIQISGSAGTVVVEAVLPQFVDSLLGITPVQIGGTALQPLISIDPATTTSPGIIQLYDATDSSSVTEALTAAQGKYLQDQISALVLSSSNLIFAGTFSGSTGYLTAVTPEGTAEGFAIGAVLPAPALSNTGYFVIATQGGTFTPTGSPSPVSATKGDWLVSSGTSWDFLDVGFDAEAATTTDTGIVRLSTDVETQTGTADTVAVTPASLQSKVSDSTSLSSASSIASSLAVKDAYDLADAAIPKSALTSKGTIIAGSGVGQVGSASPSADGLYLKSDSTCAAGVKWDPAGTVRQINTGNGLDGGPIFDTGTIVLTNTCVTPGTYTYSSFTVDQQGRISFAESGQDPITCQDFTAAGDILVGGGASTFSALPVGNDGEALFVDSTCASALKWAPTCQGTVTSIIAGSGLCGGTITGSGTICLAGTNVIPATYTNATVTVDEYGRVLGAANGSAGVTSIAAGTGLNGGVITTSGTIELANTPVTAGTYYNATVTVDPQGRITSASDGSSGVPAIPCSELTAVGDLIVASAPSTPTALPVGSDGLVLTANSNCALGIQWAAPAYPTDWVYDGPATDCIQTANGNINWNGATVARDGLYYRQLSPNIWEVRYCYSKTATGSSDGGSGSYFWKLPNNLRWDTSTVFQEYYTACASNSLDGISYGLPGQVYVRAGNWGSSCTPYMSANAGTILPWNSRCFRVAAQATLACANIFQSGPTVYNAFNIINSTYFAMDLRSNMVYSVTFCFQAL